MKAHDRRIIHSSAETDHRTPTEAWAKLDAEFNFTVDLAASKSSALCDIFYGPDNPDPRMRDGLKAEMKGERIFDNPPYSEKQRQELLNAGKAGCCGIANNAKQACRLHLAPESVWRHLVIDNWVKKLAELGQANLVVGVLPAAIQTAWWQQYVMGAFSDDWDATDARRATEVRFTPYRWSFLTPSGEKQGGAGVNHCVVIWKPDPGYIEPWSPTIRYWSYR